MPKYEVTENKLNSRKDKRTLRIVVSKDESIFLNFSADPSPEKIDAEVDIFLKNRDITKMQNEIDQLRQISANG